MAQQKKENGMERQRVRREKLACYFFDLSKLVFATVVLGGFTPIFGGTDANISWWGLTMGSIATYGFAFFANRILK